MPKFRPLSGRRWSKWPVALVLGLAAVAPVTTALVVGCGSSGDSSGTGSSSGQTRDSTWPASQETTDALSISSWRATYDATNPTKILFEGLDGNGKTSWTATYRSPDDVGAPNGQASFLTPGGQMDFGAGGITVNTLTAADKYGLAALSYDLDASGTNLPIEEPGATQQNRTVAVRSGLVNTTDGSIVGDGGGLVDAGDGGKLVEASTDPLVCAVNALLGAVSKTLGSFLSTCSNVSVSISSTGISAALGSSCTNIGQSFVNNLSSGLNSCTSKDSGAAKASSSDSGKASTGTGTGTGSNTGSGTTSSPASDAGLVNNTTQKLVGSPPSDAGGGATKSGDDDDDDDTSTDSGTTTTTTPDSGSTTTTTTPDSGTTTTTTTDAGTTTTTATDAGTTTTTTTAPPINVPYGATGYVLVDDGINTDTIGVTCTATLISSYVAVTSASCLYVKNAQGGYDAPWTRHRFAFGQGVVNDQTRNVTREAVQVVADPDYMPVDGGAIDPTKDVGLLFLLPAPAGSAISIATVSTAPLTQGALGSSVGYGQTSATQQVNGVPNANFRKTFPFTVGAPDGQLFPATVGPNLVLCGGDQGAGAYDMTSKSLIGILTSGSVTASCTPGMAGTYLTLSSFTPFEKCTIQRVADQTATYSGPTDCR